jgi:mRNA interferase MazF
VKEEYIKDFDRWNERIKTLDAVDQFEDFFYEREIWWCAFGVNVGSEQDGKNESFERPALIVKKISKDVLWVIPLTSKIINDEYRLSTQSSGIASQLILSQMRAVSSKRLLRKISRIKLVTFYLVIARLSMMLLGVIQDETPQPP